MKRLSLIVLGLDKEIILKNINYLKNLSHILIKATPKPSSTDFLNVLTHSMDVVQLSKASIAELTALFDGFPLDKNTWLRADPIELKADMAAVYMYGNQHIVLNQQQIKPIQEALQWLLAEYGLTLHTTVGNRWYLESNESFNIATTPFDKIIGKDILNFLPQSLGKYNWQKLQTEIQMVLHQLNDNSGINSLWFWGEGDKLTPAKTSNIKLFSNEAISGGLALHTKASLQPLPQEFDENFWLNLIEGENIIVYDKLITSNSADLLTQLQWFDLHYIQPLFKAVKQNKINKVTVDLLTGTNYQFKKSNFYHFWKTKKRV